MKRFLFFILICFFDQHSFASVHDSATIVNWQSRALEISRSQPDSAMHYSLRSLKASKALQNDYLIARSYNIHGIYFDIQSQWDSALYYYHKAIVKAKSCNCKAVWAGALNNIGLVYWNQSENEKAIEYYENALSIFEELGKKSGVANCLNNIGLILWNQRYYEDALRYQKQALALRMEIDDQYGLGASLTNIGLVYSEIGQFDSSDAYLKKAEKIKLEINDLNGLAIVYTNLGSTQRLLDHPEKSGYYFKKAIAIHRNLGNKKLLAANLSSLGNSYSSRELYDSAEVALLEAEKIALEIQADRELYGILIRLGRIYKSWGKHERSAHYLDRGISIYKEVFDTETNEQITEIKEKYEAEKRQKELAEQKALLMQNKSEIRQRNYLLIILFLLGLTLLLIFLGIYRQQKFRNKVLLEENRLKDQLAEEKLKNRISGERLRISQDLHDNIGSHLTFIISSIENMLYRWQKGDKELPEKLNTLNSFTKKTIGQLRDTIWAMNRELIGAADLRERLYQLRDHANQSKGLDILKLDFNEEVEFSFTSRQGIEVYRIVQEAVNNSLKHAEAENITIQVQQHDGLSIAVSDDGKGFDSSSKKEGNGLKNMAKRARNLNFEYQLKSSEGKGTSVQISIKD